MRKQELVYVHGLLLGVHEFYEERTGEAVSIPEYDAMDVRPTSIHRGKAEHEAAVFALSEALAEQIGTTPRRLRAVDGSS
jgi:hypothetical protein